MNAWSINSWPRLITERKWARSWLDLARYADSDGYEEDRIRPHAWRWRHWVIEALNRNHAVRPVYD